ncbi:MAG: TetR/AcrR family transcriptional regulator [Planctomycetota bacterium]
MSRLTRDDFLQRTQDLLCQQGAMNVSLASVLKACGANKGSLYHFFPNGKDELLIAAMQKQSDFALTSNRVILDSSDSTGEAVARLVKSLATMVEHESCPKVLPFSAAGASSDEASDTLRSLCGKTIETLQRLYAAKLREDGLPTAIARSLASVIVSTVEGSLLQSRLRGSATPLKNANIHLQDLIRLHATQDESD